MIIFFPSFDGILKDSLRFFEILADPLRIL